MVHTKAQVRLVGGGGLYLIWFLLALLGAFLTLWVSPHGFTVSPDSVYYLMGAEGIRRGLGFVSFEAGGISKPITHWPPMYSFLISLAGPGVINALFFALTVFLTSFLIYRASDEALYSVIGGTMVATSPILLKFSSMVLTETVFNFWVLLILALMYRHRETGRDRCLVLMGLVAALAVLTRYAGLFLVFPFAYYWLRRRLPAWKGFILTLSPVLTYALWKAYLLSIGGQETRHIVFHPPSGYHFRTLMETLVKFVSFVPSALLNPIILLLLAIAVILLLFTRGGKVGQKVRVLIELALVFALSYLIFLFLSISFMDFYTLPDDRILSVLYPLLVISLVSYLSTFPSGRAVPFLAILIALNLYGDVALRREKSAPYTGYNGPYYRNLQVIDYVRRYLPPDAIIYSNGPDLLWYYTRRPASMLPRVILPVERRLNPHFREEMRDMVKHLTSGKGYIVILAPVRRGYLPQVKDIMREVPVKDVVKLRDGLILVVGHGDG